MATERVRLIRHYYRSKTMNSCEVVALYGHGGLIAQQGHISLNTNLYLSQF